MVFTVHKFNGIAAMFHSRTGSLVSLSNDNKTAQRNHPAQEFNNGVVLSSEPLKDNQLFEVKIDRKVNSWSGSIELGITSCDPGRLNFPTSATGFREGTWVMSGSSILKDGHSLIEEYGRDLDQLAEGDRVGVLRTSSGSLHFFINGADQGPAATGIPNTVWAVVDMYGKCAQVTTVDDNSREIMISNELTNEAIAEASYIHSNERLTFHERCGSLVKLSNNRRTAERRRPLDEFNNGVVMTNRPIKDDELFEIRLDRLVDKWSGSIEVGITTHNPAMLEFPATMTNMRSGMDPFQMQNGTIMMSGCGILTNGKGTRREYGEFNLDELTEGDRIGLMKKANGTLHYYINGMDQGVASSRTPAIVWGVVDLYGMAVKVTIIDSSDPGYSEETQSLDQRMNSIFRQYRDMYTEQENHDDNHEVEKLLFHPHCGSHCAVTNGQRTSYRPNAMDDFNNGVVLTQRILRSNEMFEVRIDKIIDKWAGSIEIGVTTHTPMGLDFPSTMTNIRSGTWMMTGNGVMHNGTTTIDDYGQNLDRLKVGDRVGVSRKEDGTLHFFVNSIDQGPAATNVPANVYGVIDLYGQASQATIVDQTGTFDLESPAEAVGVTEAISDSTEELLFHHLHGKNATILCGGKTASRPNACGEFNDAIVMSNRPLRDNELFEVMIERMVDRWSGSIEAGVSLIRPEEIDFPNTMTDIDYDTWMLSGSAIMQDGSTVRNGYACDLDSLAVSSRIGMMRRSDATLHYFVDGVDQGVACTDIPRGVYAVMDLYGQCAQVTITNGSGVQPQEANHVSSAEVTPHQCVATSAMTGISHRFSQCCGKNVALKNNCCSAQRTKNFNHGLLFSCDPLRANEIFEIKIDQVANQWSGSLQIGLTAMAVSNSSPVSNVPSSALELKAKSAWIIAGSEVKKNGVTIKENYVPSLERLEVGNRVGIKRCSDGTMHIYINGEDMGIAATNIPKNAFAVIDLYGRVEGVTITSSSFQDVLNSSRPPSIHSESTYESNEREQDLDTANSIQLELHGNHGKNILLSNKNLTANRTASYNQGMVVSSRPLPRNYIFRVRIDTLDLQWTSSLVIGVIGFQPDKFTLPVSAVGMKRPSWMIQGDSLFHCGVKVKERYGPNLDSLQIGHVIGVMVDDDNALHLFVNGIDQGVAAKEIPSVCYAVVDLYGQCDQVTVVKDDDVSPPPSPPDQREKADMVEGVKEKICPPIEINQIKNCEYQKMCARYKVSLGLPDGYFNSDFNICFCETCHKIRGDEAYVRQGDPPKEYGVPFGWCRFALRMPAKADAMNVCEKWHVAYHGTQVGAIRKILDCGQLHTPSDVMGSALLAPQPTYFSEKKKPDDCDLKQIVVSPTTNYASCDVFAPKHEFRDPKTRKTHHTRLLFQVLIKPGSYRVEPQSIGANEQIDSRFNNNELEWSTKERGATILSGLLVKVD